MKTQEVRTFTLACEAALPTTPQLLTPQGVSFITQMVHDELEELSESKSIAEQADAFVDIIYYLMDSAVRHGIDLDPLFNIVHQANLSKIVDGKVIRRADGKILKPEGWKDPEPLLHAEIERQLQEGSFS
jgi:predicted HAD superfamily Cof-like phosphohydrolase